MNNKRLTLILHAHTLTRSQYYYDKLQNIFFVRTSSIIQKAHNLIVKENIKKYEELKEIN